MFGKRAWARLLLWATAFLGCCMVAPSLHALDIDAEGGGYYFRPNTDGHANGFPVVGNSGFKGQGSIFISQKIAGLFHLGGGVEEDATLSDRLFAMAGWDTANIMIQGGVFVSPTRISRGNPGLFANISFIALKRLYGYAGVDWTLLPAATTHYTQSRYEAGIGWSFNHFRVGGGFLIKNFSEYAVTLSDDRFFINGMYYWKGGPLKREIDLGLKLGFNFLHWQYLINNYRINDFFIGANGEFELANQLFLGFSLEAPLYAWSSGKGFAISGGEPLFLSASISLRWGVFTGRRTPGRDYRTAARK
jgi:hypothetical protein